MSSIHHDGDSGDEGVIKHGIHIVSDFFHGKKHVHHHDEHEHEAPHGHGHNHVHGHGHGHGHGNGSHRPSPAHTPKKGSFDEKSKAPESPIAIPRAETEPKPAVVPVPVAVEEPPKEKESAPVEPTPAPEPEPEVTPPHAQPEPEPEVVEVIEIVQISEPEPAPAPAPVPAVEPEDHADGDSGDEGPLVHGIHIVSDFVQGKKHVHHHELPAPVPVPAPAPEVVEIVEIVEVVRPEEKDASAPVVSAPYHLYCWGTPSSVTKSTGYTVLPLGTNPLSGDCTFAVSARTMQDGPRAVLSVESPGVADSLLWIGTAHTNLVHAGWLGGSAASADARVAYREGWTRLAVVWRASARSIAVYADGALLFEGALGEDALREAGAAEYVALVLGRAKEGRRRVLGWDGEICDARVWARALGEEEIKGVGEPESVHPGYTSAWNDEWA